MKGVFTTGLCLAVGDPLVGVDPADIAVAVGVGLAYGVVLMVVGMVFGVVGVIVLVTTFLL